MAVPPRALSFGPDSLLRSASGFRRVLLASVALLVALIWGAWFEVVRHDREQALEAAARRQGNLIIAVGHYLDRALSNADALAQFLLRVRATPGSDLRAALVDRARANELFREMLVCDAGGGITSSRTDHGLSRRQRWCAEWLRQAPADLRDFAAVPVEEGEETFVPLLTRAPAGAGRPAGVLVLLVEIRRLLALMQDYSIPDETAVLLLGADGLPRARWHNEMGLDDQRAPEAALLDAVRAGGTLGQVHAVGRRERIVSAGSVAGRALVVMVATDLEGTLADPNRRARHLAIAAAAATLLLPLFAAMLLRLQNRIVAMAQALAQARERLQVANTELEQEVQARTAELEEAYRELESFSYTVAHDVRAPIASIAGFASALEDTLPAEGKALHYLRRIQANAQQMGQLTDALLALGRLSRAPVSMAPVDLSAMARDVLAALREGDASPREADARVQEDITVLADPVLLRQVLENVLGNAWKFTARRPRTQIALAATYDAGVGRATISVHDNGEGFDASSAHDPFQPFHRMHAAEDFPGSGVGLATVDRIVRLHGGRAWIVSSPVAGTVVSFTLPAAGQEPGPT